MPCRLTKSNCKNQLRIGNHEGAGKDTSTQEVYKVELARNRAGGRQGGGLPLQVTTTMMITRESIGSLVQRRSFQPCLRYLNQYLRWCNWLSYHVSQISIFFVVFFVAILCSLVSSAEALICDGSPRLDPPRLYTEISVLVLLQRSSSISSTAGEYSTYLGVYLVAFLGLLGPCNRPSPEFVTQVIPPV